MRITAILLGMAFLTIGAVGVMGSAAAQQPGACAQANTFVFGMAHTCPNGYPQWPKDQSCYSGYYQNYVGERAGVLVWIC